MSVAMNSLCAKCLLNKHIDTARTLGTEETATAFTKDLMQLFIQADPGENSTVLGYRIQALYHQYYDLPQDRYQEEKAFSNDFVAQRLDAVRQQLSQSEDPLLCALQYAILGNYIDFSALGKTVSFEKLEDMLMHPEAFPIAPESYQSFRRDLENAHNFLYITDNAGEIGFDLLVAEILHRQYPDLSITFCVRGGPVHNDATREDAAFFQIPFPVIDNGCRVGGTPLSMISPQAMDAIRQADLILSKGMGNTECLYGSGYPIYHAFLVKCPLFVHMFQNPLMTPMFLKEA